MIIAPPSRLKGKATILPNSSARATPAQQPIPTANEVRTS